MTQMKLKLKQSHTRTVEVCLLETRTVEVCLLETNAFGKEQKNKGYVLC